MYGNILYVGPAYGRTYKFSDEAKKAWDDGQDFIMMNGEDESRYCSSRDAAIMKERGIDQVRIQWKKFEFVDIDL